MKSTARKVVGALLLAMLALAFSATAASAADSVTPNSNIPDAPGPKTVSFHYDNTVGTQDLRVYLCDNNQTISAANLFIECAQLTEAEYFAFGSPPPAIDDTFTFTLPPSGTDWTCGGSGNTGGTIVQGGKRLFSRCQIRFSPDTSTNVDGDSFLPIDFTTSPGTQVPEAPMAILLPIAGLAVAGAAYFVMRGRKPALQL